MSNIRKISSKLTNERRARWDETIQDAKEKIAALRRSIVVFEARKAAGEPWPGSEKDES
jgi:hypothetical protein